MKNIFVYLLILAIIYAIFFPITKGIVFSNYVADAAKAYIEDHKIYISKEEHSKMELPILTLKKENYIKYLIESPKKNIDVNSYYVEIINKNGEIKYNVKYKKEG